MEPGLNPRYLDAWLQSTLLKWDIETEEKKKDEKPKESKKQDIL